MSENLRTYTSSSGANKLSSPLRSLKPRIADTKVASLSILTCGCQWARCAVQAFILICGRKRMKSESVSDRAPWGHSGLHEFTFSCHVCGMSTTHRSQSVHFKALTLVCSRLSQYKAASFASRKPLSSSPTETVSQCQSSEQDYSYLFSIFKIHFYWSI